MRSPGNFGELITLFGGFTYAFASGSVQNPASVLIHHLEGAGLHLNHLGALSGAVSFRASGGLRASASLSSSILGFLTTGGDACDVSFIFLNYVKQRARSKSETSFLFLEHALRAFEKPSLVPS